MCQQRTRARGRGAEVRPDTHTRGAVGGVYGMSCSSLPSSPPPPRAETRSPLASIFLLSADDHGEMSGVSGA